MEEILVQEHLNTGLVITTHRIIFDGKVISPRSRDCEAYIKHEDLHPGWLASMKAKWQLVVVDHGEGRGGMFMYDSLLERGIKHSDIVIHLTNKENVSGWWYIKENLSRDQAQKLRFELNSSIKKIHSLWLEAEAEESRLKAASVQSELGSMKRL